MPTGSRSSVEDIRQVTKQDYVNSNINADTACDTYVNDI